MALQQHLADLTPTAEALLAEWTVPGMVVGVWHDGEQAEIGHGIANLNTGTLMTPRTAAQIGSISKTLTATLIMRLVDEGKLDLDARAIDYVPEWTIPDTAAREIITLRQLLSHTSGFAGDRFDDHGDGDDALARAVTAMSDLQQFFAPGTSWSYNNAAFDLAGRIVEMHFGKPFETVMHEEFFTPLGLTRSCYFAKDAILDEVSVGHIPTTDKSGMEVATPWPIERRSNACGGVTATVGDLLRYARLHINGGELDGTRYLSKEAAAEMAKFQTDADPGRTWGIGWTRRTLGGAEVIEHGGATNGFMARLTIIPSRNFAIACLTNGARGSTVHGKYASALIMNVLGLSGTTPTPIPVDADRIAEIAGEWHQQLALLTITPEGDGFRLDRVNRSPFSGRTTPQDPSNLVAVGSDLYQVKGGELDGAFLDTIRHPDGTVRFIRFSGRVALRA